MKWVVVALVILNIAAYLFGMKLTPDAQLQVKSGQYETINPGWMSVDKPSRNQGGAEMKSEEVGQTLEEDGLVQLKVDKSGQVLMAPTVAPQVEQSAPAQIVVAGDPEQSAPVMAKKSTAPSVSEEAPVEAAADTTPQPELPAAEPEATMSCYRLGPFSNQKSLASARRELEKQGVNYTVDEDKGNQKVKAVRVYLGAYTSDAALQAEKKRLEDLGVEHFVIRLNSTPMIQLGYFSEPARATAYQEKLQARGLEVKTEKIFHDAAIKSWLKVQQAASDEIVRLKLPNAMVKACP